MECFVNANSRPFGTIFFTVLGSKEKTYTLTGKQNSITGVATETAVPYDIDVPPPRPKRKKKFHNECKRHRNKGVRGRLGTTYLC
jgi:hypothetical protein